MTSAPTLTDSSAPLAHATSVGRGLGLREGEAVWSGREVAAHLHPGASVRLRVEAPTGVAALVASLLRTDKRQFLIVTQDTERALSIVDDLRFFLNESAVDQVAFGGVLTFSPGEATPYADVHSDARETGVRLATLFHLAVELPWRVLVCPAHALVRKVTPAGEVLRASELLTVDQDLDRNALCARLVAAGYLRTPLVEDPGSFSVRGALLDVWPPCSTSPLRVELLGDMILSIKFFDAETQRTTREVREAWLSPVRDVALGPEACARAERILRELSDEREIPTARARTYLDDVVTGRLYVGTEGALPALTELAPLLSYLPKSFVTVLDDPTSVVTAARAMTEATREAYLTRQGQLAFPPEAFLVDEAEVTNALSGQPVIATSRTWVHGQQAAGLEQWALAFDDVPALSYNDISNLSREIDAARKSRGKASALAPLMQAIEHWRDLGIRTAIVARTQSQLDRIASLLSHRNCPTLPFESTEALLSGLEPSTVGLIQGSLSRGMLAPMDRVAWVTEEDIFGARSHRTRREASTKRTEAFVEDLRSLAVGDHVVHVDHGVGRYLGLIHKTIGSSLVDLLVIEYTGGDKLYVPAYRLNQVQKFQGSEGSPKLDKLGGQTFEKTKSRVRGELRQMADELLRLYAERAAAVAPAFPPPDEDYRAFEASFPFDETPDQARAIAEVEVDLGKTQPTDRLVCGDVGFGKTEIAIRAAFRAASQGFQVAVLCPTTILAQQHFQTFSARMAASPVTVKVLSRFQSKADQEQTLQDIKAGKVDIVVGTHRLLSKDVHFKNLGLLVVDEEQRFGVTHKERIKGLKNNIHVVTLSATPIPRTLQLAISGLREMSVITTPPVDRRAIRTIVTRDDDTVLRDAIDRELARGGQVFFVYNRIEGLYERAARIGKLVPRARVGVAHGQMTEAALEAVMLDFVQGNLDVLCATAIVESGLDIPRANTMLIDRADLFGLSQLYQLRGRVGRSKERAYCYLVVPGPDTMTEEARTRIEALERHTELGSGFQVASLDLELRGAGSLLGGEQSGTVASVGFELFCQMLDDAVAELRGHTVTHDVDPELTVDIEALLPEDYIDDIGVRLSLYKKLASAQSPSDVEDLAQGMEDRFGPPPQAARNLVQLMRLKTELRELCVLGCEATAKSVTFHLRADAPLDPEKLSTLVGRKKAGYKLTPDMRLTRRALEGETFASGIQLAERSLTELAACVVVH